MDQTAKAQLMRRGTDDIFDPKLRASIVEIIEDVRANGDEAVSRALHDYDRVNVPPDRLRVSADDVERAVSTLPAAVVSAVDDMIDHIRRFNDQVMARVGGSWRFESEPGLWVGEQVTPIASAGLFCPSGKASYPSVMAQIGTPATVAGVGTRVVITPPVPGAPGAPVDAATLLVAQRLGITDIFRVNGPAGVAAVAFGTESIPQVVKVVGPGSPAVVCAQIEVQRYGCATMMLLGPTESLVIADESADPVLLAADLLNEAEHGTDSSSVLVLINHSGSADSLLANTQKYLDEQIAALPAVRQEAARAALGINGGCVVVATLSEAAEVANAYGSEHLQIATVDPDATLALIHCAGEVLLGQHTTFAAGNFLIGCPASLPTSGFASVSSGITAEAFLKRTAIAEANETAMRRMAPSVITLAEHEGFPAHAATQQVRLSL
jgi:histidinol dehydrogenase